MTHESLEDKIITERKMKISNGKAMLFFGESSLWKKNKTKPKLNLTIPSKQKQIKLDCW